MFPWNTINETKPAAPQTLHCTDLLYMCASAIKHGVKYDGLYTSKIYALALHGETAKKNKTKKLKTAMHIFHYTFMLQM